MKTRVLFLYNYLYHYRIPVWNILAQRYDLTVCYSFGNVPQEIPIKFKFIKLPARVFAHRFVLQKDNIRKLAKQYDVVIAYGDISWLKFSTLPWFHHNYKVIFHTIGVSATYNKAFDEHKEWDHIRYFFYSRADALVFYSSYPIEKYKRMGMSPGRLFVAPNTVAVSKLEQSAKKDSILFIGTLYKEKGIQILLDAYKTLKNKCSLPILNIIGKGPDFEAVSTWINNNSMQDIIKLHGAIYDIQRKAEFFDRALACISPKQAGLTVLESMGYGVPFVTSKSAITGGELFNVHSGEDGVLVNDDTEFCQVIQDISNNPEKYIEMGKKAIAFYNNHRTPAHMADGFIQAIEYVQKQ